MAKAAKKKVVKKKVPTKKELEQLERSLNWRRERLDEDQKQQEKLNEDAREYREKLRKEEDEARKERDALKKECEALKADMAAQRATLEAGEAVKSLMKLFYHTNRELEEEAHKNGGGWAMSPWGPIRVVGGW
jgi:hypothetical protein